MLKFSYMTSGDNTEIEMVTNGPENDSIDLGGPVLKLEDCNDSTMDNFITNEMVEIEDKLERETSAEAEQLTKQMDGEDKNQAKEQRYKMLMHLLTRSKFYTDFMLKKLEESHKNSSAQPRPQTRQNSIKGEVKQGKLSYNVSTHSLRERNENNLAQCSKNVPPFRRVVSKSKGLENASKNKRKREFNITELIDKETISGIEKKRKLLDSVSERGGGSNQQEETEEMRETAYGFMVSHRQPALFEGGVLKPYQLDGLDWLRVLYLNGVNGILADEMGLGKTPQTIALLCHLIEKNVPGPFLVVAPLSTLPNWIIEFERFAPKIPVLLFHGSEDKRRNMYSQLCRKNKVTDGISVCPVILTSYEIPLREDILHRIKWSYLIVDEGHRLKNHKCLLARELRQYQTGNRLLLTGTPLQNNLSELWSLLNFLLPEIFDDLAAFETWFDLSDLQQADSSKKIIMQEKERNVLSIMHQILAPFLLRRVKADVALNIPPKKELIVYAPMSPIQLELYRATVEHNYSRLLQKEEESLIIPDEPDGKRARRKSSLVRRNYKYDLVDSDDESEEKGKGNTTQQWLMHHRLRTAGRVIRRDATSEIEQHACCFSSSCDVEVEDREDGNYKIQLKMSNPMMQLRKILNHPYLVHFPLVPGKKELKVDEELVKKSGKLLVLDAMLAKLKQRGHKVLLFSTFTTMLDLLEDYLLMRKYSYVHLDGSVKVEDRQLRIKAFNTDPHIFIFLISTRAGGLGINLTSADTVIIYDSDWNPQVDLQAQDRCHRIGQTRPVVVYRFVTAGTIDEQIVERAAAKRKLEKLVIQRGKFKLNKKQSEVVNLRELLELLNSRDYQKKIHSNGYVFTDEELEELLDRSDLLCSGTETEALTNGSKVYRVVEQ